MPIHVIVQQAGPLPFTVNFQSPSDGPMILEVNGSVWTQTANEMIGIAIEVDGSNAGTASVFSNGNATHRAVVPAYASIELTGESHTITLSPSTTATVSDFNDFYTAVLHY